jgi:hypothetical protein
MPIELSDLSATEIVLLDKTIAKELELNDAEIAIISASFNRGALEIAQALSHIRAIRANRTIQE